MPSKLNRLSTRLALDNLKQKAVTAKKLSVNTKYSCQTGDFRQYPTHPDRTATKLQSNMSRLVWKISWHRRRNQTADLSPWAGQLQNLRQQQQLQQLQVFLLLSKRPLSDSKCRGSRRRSIAGRARAPADPGSALIGREVNDYVLHKRSARFRLLGKLKMQLQLNRWLPDWDHRLLVHLEWKRRGDSMEIDNIPTKPFKLIWFNGAETKCSFFSNSFLLVISSDKFLVFPLWQVLKNTLWKILRYTIWFT